MAMRALGLALLVVALGCSAETTNGSSKPTKRSMPTVMVSAEGKCTQAGANMCVCKDGTMTGTQICDGENGTLSQCMCPMTPTNAGAAGTGSDIAMPSQAGLCAELQGLSNCEASQYVAKELPASILFLVDRSGSMNCNLPPLQSSADCELQAAPTDPNVPTKWAITRDALKQVFTDLLAKNTEASIGLTFFSTDATCGVDSVPTVPVNTLSQQQVGSLTAALDTVQPDGSTPIVGSLSLAYAYLHQEVNKIPGCPEPCGAHGNRFVVLITDGADSCGSPANATDKAACDAAGGCTQLLLTDTAPAALTSNIKTFVIGSPGSEPARGFLSELAFVAGTPATPICTHDVAGNAGDCHFDMTVSPETFAQDLSTALADIGGAALACEFAVPDTGEPVVASQVNVQWTAGGSTAAPICLPKDDSAACEGGANGWQFKKNPDGTDDLTRVVLCGPACDMVRADPGAQVDVVRGCQSIVLE